MVEDNHINKQPPPPSPPPPPPPPLPSSSSTSSSCSSTTFLLSKQIYQDLQKPPESKPPNLEETVALIQGQDEARRLREKQKSVSRNRSFHQHPNFNSGQKILNDAQVIFNRRINFNQKARKCFELTCEEKISKHKLEEVHFSMPSSVKSTVIMTFSPDGQKVASTHNDHRIYICDLNTGKLLDTLEGHSKTPLCLAWHPSNREILASGSLAGEVRVWDLKSKACESWTNENNTIIFSVDFHPKERILVIATSNDIHFWDWNDSEPFAKTTTTHDKEKIKYVEFDPSGTKLITGISNLPEFGSFGSDSLQNRIIDNYLTQGTLDQLPTDNMTNNSEISSNPHINTNNYNNDPTTNAFENSNERNVINNNHYHQLQNRQLITNNSNNNPEDMSYRSTLILSRVAFLYRQLEALEDSMRHTSFSPYVSPHPIASPVETTQSTNDNVISANQANNNNNQRGQQQDQKHDDVNNQLSSMTSSVSKQSENQPAELPNSTSSTSNSNTTPTATITTETQPARVPNPLDPIVVSFDESLEHLQLSPLVIDGQTINLATVIDQYPIDFPWHLHYMMQFESMNQVNQNFIRISKLMSSVRLYRQIVQQITASNSRQVHFHPNQILTAQSTSPRSVRNVTSNLPVVFRNLPVPGFNPADTSNRIARATDPIMAIQFRNSARNVPLATICKIDLLSARSICLWRSQQLIEQSFTCLRANSAPSNDNQRNSSSVREQDGGMSDQQQQQNAQSSQVYPPNNLESTLFYPLVFQLHESLALINQAPLTTSNVHVHISNLRKLIDKLLKILASLLNSEDEGRRLTNIIHDIANSLTGRSWLIPLGANLDDIRLDVIHTLCIVDLTLHLTRQVQLLQMQRLSAIVRVEESRRLGSNRGEGVRTFSNNSTTTATTTTTTTTTSGSHNAPSSTITTEQFYGPSTSRNVSALSPTIKTTTVKRKENTTNDEELESPKRRKVDSIKDDSIHFDNSVTTDIANNNSTTTTTTNNNDINDDTNSSTKMIDTAKQLDNIDTPVNETTYTSPLDKNANSEQQSGVNMTSSNSNLQINNMNTINLPLTEQLQQTERLLVWNNASNPTPLEQSLQRFLVATASSMSNSHILVRIYSRLHNGQLAPNNILDLSSAEQTPIQANNLNLNPLNESRRRALSQDNSVAMDASNGMQQTTNATSGENSMLYDSTTSNNNNNNVNNNNQIYHNNNSRIRQFHVYPSSSLSNAESSSNSLGSFERQPHLHVYQTRSSTGQHLWFNQWTIPLPISKANCRLQCWNFSMSTIPNIKDSHSNLLTPRCRIHNDSSIDISSDGSLVGCLVPRDDGACVPNFDVKIFSLKIFDFGVCYYKLPHGPNAISVTMSPSTSYVVVGLSSNKFISNDPNDDELIVAKVYKLKADRSFGYVRDIKTKRDDSTLSLNAIKWMPRGIVYNVGPQHYQRYQTGGRIRNSRIINF